MWELTPPPEDSTAESLGEAHSSSGQSPAPGYLLLLLLRSPVQRLESQRVHTWTSSPLLNLRFASTSIRDGKALAGPTFLVPWSQALLSCFLPFATARFSPQRSDSVFLAASHPVPLVRPRRASPLSVPSLRAEDIGCLDQGQLQTLPQVLDQSFPPNSRIGNPILTSRPIFRPSSAVWPTALALRDSEQRQ